MFEHVMGTKFPRFFAHSGDKADLSDWQPLKDHLEQVGALAAERSSIFGSEQIGYLAGLLHDLGKYSEQFQRRLQGSTERADHATAGAKVVVDHIESTLGPSCKNLGKLIAFVIAGHHTGLANGSAEGKDRRTLGQRLNLQFGTDIPALSSTWEEEISLPRTIQIPELKPHDPPSKYQNFGLALYVRMLFSCLIDADRIDTENHVRNIEGKDPVDTRYPTVDQLAAQLDQYLKSLHEGSRPSPLNDLRKNILNHARSKAKEQRSSGLYSLTVPTGGGKTLTSLAFGLDHAKTIGLRRIIYVIPFTSIIEQTADVFRTAMGPLAGSVLEHHSAFDREQIPSDLKQASAKRKTDFKDKLRYAMESWAPPIVVTTAVQFFESLFSDRPSQCRKLHNIAGSVIVLDEAQTLPLNLLRPIMAAIDELALNYHCSAVLCTATQPALKHSDDFFNGFKGVTELAPDPDSLYQALKRTTLRHLGDRTDEELIEDLNRNAQILMIVNNRRHARVLFDAIQHLDGAHHMTTSMCAEHRSRELFEIRQKLKEGLPCRLIATSLIEAGVDVDFPVVYRAEAGLDSIAQAAGRCNREGLRDVQSSFVSIFNSPAWSTPPALAQLAGPMRAILRNFQDDVLAPEAIRTYFQHVYYAKAADLDSKGILMMHLKTQNCDYPFQNIAASFKMIEHYMVPIIVPLDSRAREAIQALRFSEYVGGHARALQRYTVQVPKTTFDQLLKLGALAPIAPDRFGDQFFELVSDSLYSTRAGLNLSDPASVSAEAMVI